MCGDDQRLREALVVGSLLAPEGAAAYGTAMRWWGWTPHERPTEASAVGPFGPGLSPVLFITPKRKQAMRLELLGVRFELVLIKPERMFGADLLGEPGLRMRVTNPERTVVDMFDRSDLCGGVPAAAAALEEAWAALDPERLTGYLERFAGGTVPRRLGYLVECLSLLPPGDPLLERWRKLLGAGYSLLERGGPAAGPFVRRWRLRVNVPGLRA
jgi:predicted transcriptional regulator of viral defense system